MAKTKEELNQLKIECKDLKKELSELNEDELSFVTGGVVAGFLSPILGIKSENDVIYIHGSEEIGSYSPNNKLGSIDETRSMEEKLLK